MQIFTKKKPQEIVRLFFGITTITGNVHTLYRNGNNTLIIIAINFNLII